MLKKDFILLETVIIDYILQFYGVIEEIDEGNTETDMLKNISGTSASATIDGSIIGYTFGSSLNEKGGIDNRGTISNTITLGDGKFLGVGVLLYHFFMED